MRTGKEGAFDKVSETLQKKFAEMIDRTEDFGYTEGG